MTRQLAQILVVILHIGLLSSLLGGCVAVNHRAASDEDIARANVDLGAEYFRKGQLNYALENLKKALSHNPKSIDGNALTALVYEKLEQTDKAESYFETALDLVQEDTTTYSYIHNIYGTFLCKYGRAEEAEEHFQASIDSRLNQNPEVVMENAGLCALNLQNYAKAETYFRQALKRAPNMSGVLFKMAKLKFETKAYLIARAYIQRYHDVNKEPESLAMAIEIERKLKSEQEANKLIRTLKAAFPDSDQANAY